MSYISYAREFREIYSKGNRNESTQMENSAFKITWNNSELVWNSGGVQDLQVHFLSLIKMKGKLDH